MIWLHHLITTKIYQVQIALNTFRPSIAFDIETDPLFCSAKQMTGSYMKCKTGPEWATNVSQMPKPVNYFQAHII